jgi:alkaline phosphatase D
MLKLQPDFFVHTGDIVYYDQDPPNVRNIAGARYHWQRIYGLPSVREFHRRVSSYFMRDDHDTWQNDCWPEMKNNKMGIFTFRQGQQVFKEQVPIGSRPYRSFRWGKDLQIWLTEGRDFRSANNSADGPGKTIWGKVQKEWFKREVAASDATFQILINATPLVGPDRDNKADNHANKEFTYEGEELRRFISTRRNLIVINGDRHWQYFSVHPQSAVREFGTGPISDIHAQGWDPNDFIKEYHRYLKVAGGFLSGVVETVSGKPVLTIRHYSPQGEVRHQEQIQ